MSRRIDAIEIALNVLQCPHAGECMKHGSLWGEIEDGRMHCPSPHIGGKQIDEYCVYVLAQNPGNAVDHEKFDYKDLQFLQKHHEGLVEQFTPGDVIRQIGVQWEYVVWENCVRCPTADNSMDSILVDNCSDWTRRQLDTLRPDVILAMGAYARDYFDSEFRTVELLDDGTVFVCIPHYSYLMRCGKLDEYCSFVHDSLIDVTPSYIWY